MKDIYNPVAGCTPVCMQPATFGTQNTTKDATAMQPTPLKALANQVLKRNQQCNRHATEGENRCNFYPKTTAPKLHPSCTLNKATGLKIEPMAHCLHNRSCPHLDAPGGNHRPACLKAMGYIFDMDACPAGKWLRSA